MPEVTNCYLMRDESGRADVDEMNIGTYTLKYIIHTNGLMGPISVANQALLGTPNALPAQWSTYIYQGDTDPLSRARKFSFVPDPKTVKLWYATVTFEPPQPGEAPVTATGESNPAPIKSEPVPWDRSPVVWWDREVSTVFEYYDKDGKAVRNKANGLYPNDIEHERMRGVLVVEINVRTLAEVIHYSRKFDGAVNSAAWRIIEPAVPVKMALCREVSCGPPQSEQGYTFFHLTFRIVFADDGATWDVRKVEAGEYHWMKNEKGDYIKHEGYRQRFEVPGGWVALTDEGLRLADDQEFVLTAWSVRREVDFNDLPLLFIQETP
jgi:hypothetical protein